MVQSFDGEWLQCLGQWIADLERFQLEGARPEAFALGDMLDPEQVFFRVCALADFWHHRAVDFTHAIIDLVIGAHHQQHADLTLVMCGSAHTLSVFLSLGSASTTQTLLSGFFPGIVLEPISAIELIDLLDPHLRVRGVITGVPSWKPSASSLQEKKQEGPSQAVQLEWVVRGMSGASWVYLIQAHPRPRHKVVEQRMRVLDRLSQVTSRMNEQWTSTKQKTLQVTSVESGSETHTESSTMLNYRAQYLMRLLELELERLDQAGGSGQWTTRIFFGACTADDASRLGSLLVGTLAGSGSRPEPVRAALCERAGAPLEAFQTRLSSLEVAALIQLPREEVPGYAIHDAVRFDVDSQPKSSMTIPLGSIQHNGRNSARAFAIGLAALSKHAVVVGVTGSGKTTTVMNLLTRLVEVNLPFLVIEPAKTEYRALRKALCERADVRIYTLGDEMVAPFRLNPFEFETGDVAGSASVLTHIDVLKAVFNAAFPLYAPMPQVLETALHEVYEEKGWDITLGINRRIPDWSERHLYPIFPTMTDLYQKVEEVTNRLNYHQEVESNVKAALKARIGSLRLGSKGLMLDTPRGIPMQQLLSQPTIFEMERVGSDDEKTFLMGLFLAKLYEYRRLQVATGAKSSDFQHLIVIEEAHRLLQNTSIHHESSNMRVQAIEVFTNMLSEMRAYGQGVLVAEQIPSKLAPDVFKNTNLKIVHRLVAQDDRQMMGQTMNLDDEQQRHLGILTPGMAAISAEGADHAYLVRIASGVQKTAPLTDRDLAEMSREYASIKACSALRETFGLPSTPFGGPDPFTFQAARRFLERERCRKLWSQILLRLLGGAEGMGEMVQRFSEEIEAEMPYLSTQQHTQLLRMVIVLGSTEMMQRRGMQFGWTYPQTEELSIALARSLLLTLDLLSEGICEEGSDLDECLTFFAPSYRTLMQRPQGPFVGCLHCQARCQYRAEVKTLCTSHDTQTIQNLLTTSSSDHERSLQMARVVTQTVKEWLGDENDECLGVAYCLGVHALAQTHFSAAEQQHMSKELKEYLTLV